MNMWEVTHIIKRLMAAKRAGARLTGKSIPEKQLQAWIDEPAIPLPPGPSEPSLAEPVPPRDLEFERYLLSRL